MDKITKLSDMFNLKHQDIIQYMENINNKLDFEDILNEKKKINKQIIYNFIKYRINLYQILFYKNLLNITLKFNYDNFKSLQFFRNLVSDLNEIINIFNKNCYGILKNDQISIFKNLNFNIIWTKQVLSYNFLHNLYNFSTKDNIYEEVNVNIEKFELKGLIIFIQFRVLKTVEKLSILTFFNEYDNNNRLYCTNLYDIIIKIDPNLINEIKFLIDNTIKINNNNLTENDYIFICCLNLKKDNHKSYNDKKINILDIIYNFKPWNKYHKLDLNIYYYFKNKKNSKKFLIESIYNNINFINIIDKLDQIFYINPIDKKVINLNPKILTHENKIYILLNDLTKFNLNNYFKINYENNDILISNFEKIKIKINIKSILYSNFSNNNQSYNYNTLLLYNNTTSSCNNKINLYNKEIFIPDIIQPNINPNDNKIYIEIDKVYVIRNYNIIMKRFNNDFIYYLTYVVPDIIDWASFIHFIINEKKISINNINLNILINNLLDYQKYDKNEYDNIIKIFYFYSITDLLKEILKKSINNKNIILNLLKKINIKDNQIINIKKEINNFEKIILDIINFKIFIIKNY